LSLPARALDERLLKPCTIFREENNSRHQNPAVDDFIRSLIVHHIYRGILEKTCAVWLVLVGKGYSIAQSEIALIVERGTELETSVKVGDRNPFTINHVVNRKIRRAIYLENVIS